MATNRQDGIFAKLMSDNVDEIKMSNTTLDSAIEWIADELAPDDVFSTKKLETWAESNGYVKE